MRILSQSGLIDVPYEQVALQIFKNTIYALDNSFYDTTFGGKIAEYSTEAKAKKAMEMLREAYAGLPIIMQNVDVSEDVAELFEKWKKQGICIKASENEPSKVECVNSGYFKFPADEDLEV